MSTNVLMVFPRFNPNSFWSLQAACDFYGARCPAPPLGLITVAALLPPTWNVRLINRNAETLELSDLQWADLVMTGGMLPQQPDTMTIIELCRAHAKPVAVGGPDATSRPDVYRQADYLVLGEAEGIIDRFIAAWSSGTRSGVFQGEKFQVDVTRSPTPRYDLLKLDHYVNIGIQFSRGCPFNCEFCDIIELFGRVPRTKTIEQVLRELDTLLGLGYRGHVDFVDDNFIGNKKALKRLLPALAKWQSEHGYPFRFSTEASLNLADDPELLQMMRDANFFAVFVGIESPDTETLISTQKKQNTRRSIADSVHKIYGAGMFVVAGFIVGFDSEKASVAAAMVECIEATSIPMCMVGLLTALPNTQLTRRLEKEGRLLPLNMEVGDQCTGGLNFVTRRPRREVLTDFRNIVEGVYRPAAYFARVRAVGRALNRPHHGGKRPASKKLRDLQLGGRLVWCMTIQRPELRRHFWRTIVDCLRHNPRGLQSVGTLMVLYLHLGSFAKFLIEGLDRQIEAIDHGEPQALFPSEMAHPA
ncbi:MAG TPA: B12-binding domain-containing radical SAM protein [Alphaproteobacteria bacterium]|nr:B12-binding domain-containing radical SAM protein [Alphaproteobacteria bacterium]